jgi:hypothetical protein
MSMLALRRCVRLVKKNVPKRLCTVAPTTPQLTAADEKSLGTIGRRENC